MVNQVTIKLKTIKGEWSTTFQKSTRVKDVILALKVHFRLPKDGINTIHKEDTPDIAMQHNKALVNYNVSDGDVLELKQE